MSFVLLITETGTVHTTSSNGGANTMPFSPRRGSSSDTIPPGGVVVTSVDEVPPPSYTTVTGGTPVVTCRVCQVSSQIFAILILIVFFLIEHIFETRIT